ncbi:MAG: ABC transporter permease [Gemmatimonas sp.]
MRVLTTLVLKEFLLLKRDWHALALLFVMPAFFILLMSLAMRDVFATGRTSTNTFRYYLVNEDTTGFATSIANALGTHAVFQATTQGSAEIRRREILNGSAQFEVVIPLGFTRSLPDSVPLRISVVSGAGVSPPVNELFRASVREAVTSVYLRARVAALNPALSAGGGDFLQMAKVNALLNEETLYESAQLSRRPTSVQQNVPAWLVFAMFFVALPLSTTWLQERNQGSLTKLRSIGLSPVLLLAGKLLPYLLVNMVQVLLMLVIGVWVVPVFGGDALTLGHSPLGLAVIALATGTASVSYGLLIANLVSTTEQATIATGATNLLLGALGGVMVPRSIMPEALQHVSMLSPMSWGLEGFLDILLREGGVRTIAPKAVMLVCFALVSLTLAGFRLQRARTF